MDRLTYSDIARIVGTGLIATGTGLLLFVAITVAWGDPFTRVSEASAQQTLERQVASFAQGSAPLRSSPLDPDLTRLLAKRTQKSTKQGAALGRIRIPKIDIDKVVVNGAAEDDLQKGPGLYETGFPGSGGPVAIAGHRTTFGAPFLHIDALDPGDAIVLDVEYGRFTYRVTRTRIVNPNDWSVIAVGEAEPSAAKRKRFRASGRCSPTCEHLVLTACHPKYSAAQRIAVFARLERVQLSTREPSA